MAVGTPALVHPLLSAMCLCLCLLLSHHGKVPVLFGNGEHLPDELKLEYCDISKSNSTARSAAIDKSAFAWRSACGEGLPPDSPHRQQMLQGYEEVWQRLGNGSASDNAAAIMLQLLQRSE